LDRDSWLAGSVSDAVPFRNQTATTAPATGHAELGYAYGPLGNGHGTRSCGEKFEQLTNEEQVLPSGERATDATTQAPFMTVNRSHSSSGTTMP
jgi:hypothetical protein